MNNDEEENAVRQLGDLIGYGRMMQLAEQLWRKKLKPQGISGGEHTVGPCAALMVKCPHPENGRDENGHCDWCCGSGRVTRKVLAAMSSH
jgi:hypothetical protein